MATGHRRSEIFGSDPNAFGNLPEPGVIAAEIVEDLQVALD